MKFFKPFAVVLLITIPFLIFLNKPSKTVKIKNTFELVNGINTYLPYEIKNVTAAKLNQQADYYFGESQFPEAVHHLKLATEIEPDNPRLYFNLATCYSFMDSFNLEVESLNQAIHLDPRFAGFYFFRGMTLYKHKQLSNAIKDFQVAVSIDSSNWVFYTRMAMAYYDEGKVDSACYSFKKAKTLGFEFAANDKQDLLRQLEAKCSL